MTGSAGAPLWPFSVSRLLQRPLEPQHYSRHRPWETTSAGDGCPRVTLSADEGTLHTICFGTDRRPFGGALVDWLGHRSGVTRGQTFALPGTEASQDLLRQSGRHPASGVPARHLLQHTPMLHRQWARLVCSAYFCTSEERRRRTHGGLSVSLLPLLMVGLLLVAAELPLGRDAGPSAARQELSELDRTLIEAAGRGDVDGVRVRLDQGACVYAAEGSGRTALIAAAYRNHLDAARLLVEAGANVNLADGPGVTPLAHAWRRGFAEMADILEGAGAR